MQNLGGSLIGIGVLSYLLPLLGYQFKIVQAIGAGGGITCVAAGIALLGLGVFLEKRKAQRGDSFVNVVKLNLSKGQIDQSFYIKLHLFALSFGGNNLSTLNTFKALHKGVYEEFADDNFVQEALNSMESWAENFGQDIEKAGKSLNREDRQTLVKSIFAMAYGDGVVTEDEKNFLIGISQKLKLSEEELLECIKTTQSNIRAA